MTGKTIDDLRSMLFETMQAVKDGSMDLDRAKVMGDLSQVVINTAKVEVQYLTSASGGPSKFLEGPEVSSNGSVPALPGASDNPLMGIVTRRHRLK